MKSIVFPSLAFFALFFVATIVVAHEHRIVEDKYLFIVGFEQEPTFATFINAASLAVTINDTGLPVSGLQTSINIAVSMPGDSTAPLSVPLATVYGSPQMYYAWFVPTKPGAYTFHFTGSIYDTNDGTTTTIDEVFTSGNGFDVVQDVSGIYYPAKPSYLSSSSIPMQSAVLGALVLLSAMLL